MSTLFDDVARRLAAGHAASEQKLWSDSRIRQLGNFIPAAVLVAITERPRPGVLLLHRPSTMRAHPGQIAFPGGRIDPGETPVEAALREANEELGIRAGDVRVIGASDLYRTGSGYEVTPVVAVIPPDLQIHPNPAEVAQWFEAPLDFILDPANQHTRTVEFDGRTHSFIEIVWNDTRQDHRIWGVTGAILHNLAGRLNWPTTPQPEARAQKVPTMTDVLDAPWMHRDDLVALVAALGPGNARYVGGAVRDSLLGFPVKDIDMATILLPDVVIERLSAASIRSVPTGIEHGTVTAVLPDGPVEITTLRHDVSTDGRRATVAFAEDWREDAARRDFTINALYADPTTGEVFDWFAGLADLAARRVRFIGDARQRIREDYLRILRYFRFQARFGSNPADAQAEGACTELAPTLKGLSRERVGMETMNLLGLANPAPTVARMQELGVLPVFLPEAQPASLAALVAAEQAQGIAPDAVRRLAALLPAQPPLAEQVAARFRLSGAQKKRLSLAAARDAAPGDARILAYRIGRDSALDRLLIAGADVSALDDWEIPQLPLKGGQIVARGVGAGPDVARILQRVEDRWIAEGFPPAERVDGLLDEVLAEHAG